MLVIAIAFVVTISVIPATFLFLITLFLVARFLWIEEQLFVLL